MHATGSWAVVIGDRHCCCRRLVNRLERVLASRGMDGSALYLHVAIEVGVLMNLVLLLLRLRKILVNTFLQ